MISSHAKTGLAAAVITLAGFTGGALAQSSAPRKASGTVQMQSVQAGYIGSISTGSGVLRYKGKSYPFTVSGLGVGGMGISRQSARGNVYNLNTRSDFEGLYGQARTGWALGNRGKGQLLLENPAGVVLRLSTHRTGLSTSTGVDGVSIRFSN